jgi:hypothetical protein
MVAALETTRAIRRDEREPGRARRRRQRVRDLVGSDRSEGAEAALLPGAHEPTDALVVRDGGTGGRESEAAAGALATPLHGPGGRSAAAVAPGRAQPREGVAAGPAQLLSGGVAGDAAHGQDQV